MNFIETYKAGQAGKNVGYSTGIIGLDIAINGVQRGSTYTVAAAPKVGKTTFVDFAFLLAVYLDAINKGILHLFTWIYYSFEIDRVSKEFKFAAFFMAYDHGVYFFDYKGKRYLMNQDYLMGRLKHRIAGTDDTEMIPVSPEHEVLMKRIYAERIIPLFGEFSDKGKQLKPGKIIYFEDTENPTGIDKYLKSYARLHGTFIEDAYLSTDDQNRQITKQHIIGYSPNNPDEVTIIITDHTRKLKKERGFTMKENIDKFLEYSTWLRNICKFTFIHVVHSGRALSNVDRLRMAGEFIFPTADDTKDSGNYAEESTILMTLFNPNDEKYNLTKHFGVELKDFPNYRSIHITDSRFTDCPQHIQVNMLGGINMFTKLSV